MTNDFLAYTIFADTACTKVSRVINLYGDDAEKIIRSFAHVKGGIPKEGDVICACRIDRIGSQIPSYHGRLS